MWRIAAAYASGLYVPRAALPLLCWTLACELRRRRFAASWLPVLGLAATLGHCDRAAPLPRLSATGLGVQVDGWIVSPAETYGTVQRALLEVETLRTSRGALSGWSGTVVRLRMPLRFGRVPAYGTAVVVRGTLRAARPARNFGVDGEENGLRAQGAMAVLEVQRLETAPAPHGPAWRRLVIEPLRRRIATVVRTTLGASEAGVLVALLVGVRDGVDAATNDAWAALGANHILSISGMHVALVAGAVLLLGGKPTRRHGLVALLAAIWIYAAIGGCGPTVLRAAFMASGAAIASFLHRARRSIVALGMTSLGLVMLSPERRADLGLALSCAATAGLLAIAPLAGVWTRRLGSRGWSGKLSAFLVGGVAIGVACQIATLPLQLAHFGAVSWVAPVANLVMVPLSDAALVTGLAGVVLAFGSTALGRPLLLVSGGLLHLLERIAAGASQAWELRLFPPVDRCSLMTSWILAATSLLALLLWPTSRRRTTWGLVVAAASSLVVLTAHAMRPASPTWRLEALDVGQGDALVLSLGSNAWVIDTGDSQPVDAGGRILVPHLRRLGIHRLRGLVLTHPHRDHCGGAAALLGAIAVDTLYVARASHADSLYAGLRQRFTAVPIRELAQGDRLALGGEYAATVLWPESTDVLNAGPNGTSVALLAQGGNHPDWVTMGDLEANGEARIVPQLDHATRSCVLKAGHHGSDTSSTPALLDVLQPAVAIMSVGARNRYGHPGRHTLAAFAARNCRVLRTDQGGAIRLVQRGCNLWLERPGKRACMLGPVDAFCGPP